MSRTKLVGEDANDKQGDIVFDVAIELSQKQGLMTDVNWSRAERGMLLGREAPQR